jgi:hypothetical protein
MVADGKFDIIDTREMDRLSWSLVIQIPVEEALEKTGVIL